MAIMADKQIIALVIALNAIAAGVLYNRFNDHPLVQTFESKVIEYYHTIVPPKVADRCGALKWEEFIIVSNRVVTPEGVGPAAVRIRGNKIVAIEPWHEGQQLNLSHVLNFKDAVVSPGVIDVHIHLNEPGREEWEGMLSGTTAAILGGVTTVIDMPLNSNPVTTTVEQLRAKQAVAKAKARCNIGFWAGIVPENAANHTALGALLDAGALGFKSFMCPSGIDDFAHVAPHDVAAALPLLKARGVPHLLHAEMMSEVESTEGKDPRAYATYMATRPPKFEQDAIKAIVDVLDADRAPVKAGWGMHIVHLADAGAISMVKDAQARHSGLTAETCAHYLTHSAESIPDGATQYKCAPPLRDAANKRALIEAVASGEVVSMVSSDHSPAPSSMKEVETGDFLKAWGGISGVQYLLPATYTALKSAPGGVDLVHLAQLLSAAPAQLAGLGHRKGKLAPGMDADIMVWEPEAKANTTLDANAHKHKLSPYTDMELEGKVIATFLNGDLVKIFGKIFPEPCGKIVTKGS